MKSSILETAQRTINIEAESIAGLASLLSDDFVEAINTIYNSNGRLVVSGIGKSAIVAQKIVATLNSTGTASLFMHAADAIHGDLGMIREDDIVMIISKSGESPEVKVLIPLVNSLGNRLIGMGGNTTSYLSQHCSYFINTTIEKEACPNNLAPTSSTTAQMVMGDAMAVCLMDLKGFTGQDFAKFHPGGNLGKRLYLRVKDLYKQNGKPVVNLTSPLKEVIVEITRYRLGATTVINNENSIVGIITDGDLRRMLENSDSLEKITAEDILSPNPKTISPEELAIYALDMLRNFDISQLIVATEKGEYKGMLHLHDLIREGIV